MSLVEWNLQHKILIEYIDIDIISKPNLRALFTIKMLISSCQDSTSLLGQIYATINVLYFNQIESTLCDISAI